MTAALQDDKPSSFQDQLDKDRCRVESFLKESLSTLKTPPLLLDALHYGSLSGGKRLRPFLALETVRLFKEDASLGLPIAGALEFVHCYSLIHDDLPCMDDAHLRRGLPTVHCHFDEATALLAGNSLFTLAFEILAEAPYDPKARVSLIKRLAKASGAEGMMAGQHLDIMMAGQHLDILGERSNPTLEEIIQMQTLKTGALIEASLLMPCDITDATMEQRQALSTYGRCLGLAFQIKDDLLDLENNPDLTGKDGGHDLHKTTFITHLGKEKAWDECQRLIDKAIDVLKIFQGKAFRFEEAARFCLERKS